MALVQVNQKAKRYEWKRAERTRGGSACRRGISRQHHRGLRLKRFQAMGGMALLGVGLLAAVASGGGPDATISGEAVAFSSVGVGMMLSGLGLVTHADNSDREATLHRRPSAARTGHVSGERF